jgi:putative glutamine amidotransferase
MDTLKGEWSMFRERPRIGITMRIELESNRFYLARDYSEAVEAAGGIPVHISLIPSRDYVAGVMENLDGILLPGSDSDVNPALFGKEPHAALGSVHPIKDETDMLVLEEIALRGTPLLAICFGMQIFNVVRGGTLIQDIPAMMPEAINHQQGKPRDHRSHRVRLLEGSVVSELAGTTSVMVNSHHHQAIEKVGQGLVATAWTSDGLIEAMEDPASEQFLLAVQWHPEIGWRDDEFSKSLFSRFVEAAREFASTKVAIPQESGKIS